ncbi:MAG: tRNA 2-thiocytidine(32) synthetase TtcA [Bacteroidales bacterium]|nr:MAG: tRNA 2-thiocytidine(32) synthetase TtcA [Bacteroidales bacterium]
MSSLSIIKKLEGKVNKTIFNYSLIENGDRVMVGLSGGKDSYSLLDLLISRRNNLPIKFEIHACHIMATDMDYKADISFMKNICQDNNVNFLLKEITVDYNPNNRKPACFICSWKRRKMLFSTTRENNCNKLALGHHLDDAIETLLMNMINHSSISSIPPILSMFNGDIKLIRPLSTCKDNELEKYAAIKKFPTELKKCIYEKDTHRNSIRQIIQNMELINKDARQNIYNSMQNIIDEYIVNKPLQ